MDNYFGQLKVPVLGISLEQLILILYPSFLIPAVFLWFRHMQMRKSAVNTPAGCIKLRLQGRSHMEDQYDDKYDAGVTDQSQWRVKAIHIHPIKSCAAVELDEVELEGSGMTWDRKFAFAELLPQQTSDDGSTSPEKSSKWTFRTLRTPGYEKLALVKPEVWIPRQNSMPSGGLRRVEQTGALVVKYPNIPTGALAFLDRFFMRLGFLPQELSFQVPLTPPPNHTYPRETINIWYDNPDWLNVSEHLPDTFRNYIDAKHPIALFRADPDPSKLRQVYKNDPKQDILGFEPVIGANDSFPLHILNLASVHELGHRIKDSIPEFNAKRFRCNILVSGPPAYDEDDWRKIAITSEVEGKQEKHIFHGGRHTTRCRLPNVDPDTSERHPSEPDKTMRTYRCIDEDNIKKACMGIQAVPALIKKPGGKIIVRVGDNVTVQERGRLSID